MKTFNLYVAPDGSVGGTLSSYAEGNPGQLAIARVRYATVREARERVGACAPGRVVTVGNDARRIEQPENWGWFERRATPRADAAPFAFDDLPPGGVV